MLYIVTMHVGLDYAFLNKSSVYLHAMQIAKQSMKNE